MKRWKKIVLILLALCLCSQLPFAYRRYKLGRLQTAIDEVNSKRKPSLNAGDFVEYKGVMHVHSSLGGHSTGTFADIINAAKANQLDFVVMTEHPSKDFDTAAMTLNGVHAGVLFVNGNEVVSADHDRFLLLPGRDIAANADATQTRDVVSQQEAKDGIALVAYPQEFQSWSATGYNGVEVYNLYTNARRINPVVTFFDALWSYRSHADLLFARFYERPTESLKLWDEAIARTNRKLVATAGNDAHANIGVSLNDSSGKKLIGLQLDPYERSFRLLRMHVLIPKDKSLNRETLLAAIRGGHCFIGFDLFGDSTGFVFSAANGSDHKIEGDEMNFSTGVHLNVATPIEARVVLLENGTAIQDESGQSRFDFPIKEKGVYRVEVYLPQLGKLGGSQPWIISNPIYVR